MNFETVASHLSRLSGQNWQFQPKQDKSPFYHDCLTCVDDEGDLLIIYCKQDGDHRWKFVGFLQYPSHHGYTNIFNFLTREGREATREITAATKRGEMAIASDIYRRLLAHWLPAFKEAIARYQKHRREVEHNTKTCIRLAMLCGGDIRKTTSYGLEACELIYPGTKAIYKIEVGSDDQVKIQLNTVTVEQAEAIIKLLSA